MSKVQDDSRACQHSAAGQISPSTSTARIGRFPVFPALLVATALAAAVGLGANAFVGREDSILRFPEVSHAKHIPEIFGADFTKRTQGSYEPLPYAVLALGRTAFPAVCPWCWPILLVAIHLLNGFLVYAIARRFLPGPWPPVVAAALFLLHPAASAFLSQPDHFPAALAATFWLGGLACYLRWRDPAARGRVLPFAGSVLLFAVGLLASRTLMTLPALILVLEIARYRSRVLRAAGTILPYAVVGAIYVACIAPIRPTTIYFVSPPPSAEGAFHAWLYAFASGGLDRLAAFVTGAGVPPAAGVLLGPVAKAGAFSLFSVSFTVVILFALSAVLARRAPRYGLALAGLWLAFAATAPEFGSWWAFSTDHVTWVPRALPLAGLALLAGFAAEAVLSGAGPLRRKSAAVAACALAALLVAGLAVEQFRSREPVRYWRHALTANPASEGASLELGRAELARGDVSAAWPHLFAKTMTAVRESCFTAARHYARTGDSVAAIDHLSLSEREMEYGFTLHEALRRRAEVFLEMGAWDFAEQYVGQSLMVEPKNTAALRLMARVLETKGFVKAARKCLLDAARIDPGDPETTRALGAIEERLSRPAPAEPPVRVSPPSPDLLRYAVDQGEPETVREQVIAAADAHPEDPVLQLSSGIAAGRAKRHELALALVDRSIRGLPSYSYTWASRCWVLANAGRTAEAREAMKHVPNPREWDAMTWQQFGYNLARDGSNDFAMEAFRFALSVQPDMPEAHNNLALLFAQRGRNAEALEHLRRALVLPIERRGTVHNALGCVLTGLGRDEEARTQLSLAIELEPKRSRGYHNLAQLYATEGRYLDVERVLADGVRAIPGDVPLRTTLALMLAAAPRASERNGPRAVRVAESALKLCSPRSVPPEVIDALAAAYAECGRFAEAFDAAQQAAVMARRLKNPQLASDIERRADLYRIRSPFHMTPPPRTFR